MENTAKKEMKKIQENSSKLLTNWKFITFSVVIIIALIFSGLSYYQATHFNANVTINGTNVGGLTADKAIKKLKTSMLKNRVFVGQQQILDEKDTKMGFSDRDLPELKKILKRQWTFFLPRRKKITR